MSEWQPARYAHAHPDVTDRPNALEALTRMVLRVRPAIPPNYVIAEYRRLGCKAEKFFEAHRDDADEAHGAPQYGTPWLCEHEVETD